MGKRTKATVKLWVNALGRLRHSKGFGIHSPFAFTFVLRVLKEKCAYYAYAGIESRRTLARRLASTLSGEHVRVISLKNAKMLFRIVCCFNPRAIIQIGTSYGVSTYAAMSVSSTSRLVLYKGCNSVDEVFDAVTAEYASRIVEADSVEDAFDRYAALCGDSVEMLMVNDLDDDVSAIECAEHARGILDRGGVVVVRNLLVEPRIVDFLRSVTESLGHGMTFTNGRLAVIVGYRHLPRQRFDLWF